MLAGCGGEEEQASPAQETEPAEAAPEPLKEVTLRLDWLPAGHHAGFYVAADKGFYEAEGLDVDIREGKGSTSTVQLVGAKQDTFGFVAPVAQIPGVAAGAQAVMVAHIIQKDPSGILVRADSGIEEPTDLEGELCVESPFGYIHKLVPLFYETTGVDGSKVDTVSVDPSASIPGMAQGKFKALCDTLFEDIDLAELGVETKMFRFADYGINAMAHGVVAHADTIAEDPDLVGAFVRASLKGWQDAFDDPEEAAAIMKKLIPDAEEEVIVKRVELVAERSHTERSEGQPLGWMAREDWVDAIDLQINYLDLPKGKAPAVEDIFTNDFIPSQ